MTKEKRNIQIVLDKLWIEYSQLYQKVNNLDYFLETHINEETYQIELMCAQHKIMNTYLNILKQRIDDLSKQFKECK